MSRGNDQAQQGSTQALTNSTTAANNAQSLYSTVAPQLASEAANPTGYNPADLSAMETGAQQSAGGTQAAAVGQGALLGARTRNAGAPTAAIDSAARGAGETLSKNALGIQTGNAKLKEQQRQSGLSGLTGLTGMETGASNAALGANASNVNANTQAANQSWDAVKYLLDPTLQLAGGASYTGSTPTAGAQWSI